VKLSELIRASVCLSRIVRHRVGIEADYESELDPKACNDQAESRLSRFTEYIRENRDKAEHHTNWSCEGSCEEF
jgi:hypothetical protein